MGFSKNEIVKLIKEAVSPALHKLTCAVQENSEIEGILAEIRDLLQAQTESVDLTLYCDDECTIMGAVSFYRPEGEDSPLTPVYFDASLQPTDTPPEGVPCTGDCAPEDYESKFFEKDLCTDTGDSCKEVLHVLYINGVEVSTNTFWIVGGVRLTEDPGCTQCTDCVSKGSQGIIINWDLIK